MEVLAANHIVKQQLLTIPERIAGDLSVMTDPQAIRQMLRESIINALHELAYEQQHKVRMGDGTEYCGTSTQAGTPMPGARIAPYSSKPH